MVPPFAGASVRRSRSEMGLALIARHHLKCAAPSAQPIPTAEAPPPNLNSALAAHPPTTYAANASPIAIAKRSSQRNPFAIVPARVRNVLGVWEIMDRGRRERAILRALFA